MSTTRSPRSPHQLNHPSGLPAVRRCRRGPTAAVAGAALLAVLAASCGADDSPTATPRPAAQVTTIPPTKVTPATTPGQPLRGTGYRLRLPTGWNDTTAAARNAGFQVDVSAGKPLTRRVPWFRV
jgi:hypothetical protein